MGLSSHIASTARSCRSACCVNSACSLSFSALNLTGSAASLSFPETRSPPSRKMFSSHHDSSIPHACARLLFRSSKALSRHAWGASRPPSRTVLPWATRPAALGWCRHRSPTREWLRSISRLPFLPSADAKLSPCVYFRLTRILKTQPSART